jgi:hypothetical protein
MAGRATAIRQRKSEAALFGPSSSTLSLSIVPQDVYFSLGPASFKASKYTG